MNFRAIHNYRYRITLAALALVALVILLSRSSSAQELTLTREVFLEKGVTAHPTTIVRTKDGGFVIAGVIDGAKEAWATRTDAEGNFKWRYLAPAPDQSMYAPDPLYMSAAVMPDDSVFLCGYILGPKGGGLLTHLDKDGKVLDEQILKAHVEGGRFLSCIPSDGGLLIVGDAYKNTQVEPTPSHLLPVDTENFYWLLSLDQNGKTVFDKLIPRDHDEGDQDLTVTQARDGGFIFSAADVTVETTIVHISQNGDIIAKRVLPETLQIVQPETHDAILQLIPPDTLLQSAKQSTSPIKLITLNDELQETSRVSEVHGLIVIKQAYRLTDHSVLLFGSLWDPASSSGARVTWLDPTLKHEKVLDLAQGMLSYNVDAAVPLDKPGEFACVRWALDPVKSRAARTDQQRTESTLGVALDFISLKPSN